MYPHNPRMGPPNARFNELLDQLRSEFDTHIRAGESYEHQSTPLLNPDRLARPSVCLIRAVLTTTASVNAQVNEMQLVREKVYQMEQTHMTLKQKFVRLAPVQACDRKRQFSS